jgi:hypothetical protein
MSRQRYSPEKYNRLIANLQRCSSEMHLLHQSRRDLEIARFRNIGKINLNAHVATSRLPSYSEEQISKAANAVAEGWAEHDIITRQCENKDVLLAETERLWRAAYDEVAQYNVAHGRQPPVVGLVIDENRASHYHR